MFHITESEFDKAINSSLLHEEMGSVLKATKKKSISFEKNPEIMQRCMEREMRKELKSRDGVTAEIYDQFYRDHKLLLKLFVLLGVMPVNRSGPGLITFNWKSPQMTYAFIVYIFTSALVIRVGYERVRIMQTTEEFDEYIYAIIFVIFLVPHFWIPYVGWGVANRVAHYKTMWGSFQVRYYRVTGCMLTFPLLNILILILFIGCVLLSLIFLYSLSRMLDGFLLWHTTAYFHIITMINMNAALFYINSRAIKRASSSLSQSFKNDLKVECTSKIISQYRLLWLNLSELLQTLGSAYARTYSTYCLFMRVLLLFFTQLYLLVLSYLSCKQNFVSPDRSINITIGSYGALSEIFESGVSYKVLGLVVLTIYCAYLLFIVCDCANSATSVVAEDVQNTLLTMNLMRIETQTQREIDHFISAIEMNPPLVNMQGYGMINRELLTATASTIAIYLIVLLQFKLTIVAEKALSSTISKNT